MRKSKIISLGLAICIFLSGCGESPAGTEEEIIELREPKASKTEAVIWEPVVRRDLFVENVYNVVVYPYVSVYWCEYAQVFEAYGAMVGDVVQEGTQLLYPESTEFTTQIEQLEELIAGLTESYEDYRKEAEETLYTQRLELENLQEILDNMEEQRPGQYITEAGKTQTANPEYSVWEREYNKWMGQYNKKELTVNKGEEALRQKRELYELDYAYYSRKLQDIKAQERKEIPIAEVSGEVVAMAKMSPGDTVPYGRDVMAISDMDKKKVMCHEMTESIRTHAKEIYAVLNGKRYELTFEENSKGADGIYSTFAVVDDNNELSVGDRGAVVAMQASREQALAVSKDAVIMDGYQSTVYVMEDGNSVVRQVQTGITDGIYIEIVSGLEEGELIQVPQATGSPGIKTAVLEKGDVGNTFGANANLLYLTSVAERNPIEYGTVYFGSYKVVVGQYVEKGDVIAKVWVEGDKVALENKEINLQRAKERLNDIIAKGEEGNEKIIAQRQEAIAGMEEEIAKMRADYNTTEIRATASGRVLSRQDYVQGRVIPNKGSLMVIAEEDMAYLEVEVPLQFPDPPRLNYGDVVTISYLDSDEERHFVDAKVSNLYVPNEMGDLAAGATVWIKLPENGLEGINIADSVTVVGNTIYSRNPIHVIGTVEVVKNVVLVPKEAITMKNGRCYVNVVQEDGSIMPVGFVVGGIKEDFYWVAEGLTEGMKICWE